MKLVIVEERQHRIKGSKDIELLAISMLEVLFL
jgi:hypothetical protein